MLGLGLTATTINQYGRLDALKQTVDAEKAHAFLEACGGKRLPKPIVNMKVDAVLRTFILDGRLSDEMRTCFKI